MHTRVASSWDEAYVKSFSKFKDFEKWSNGRHTYEELVEVWERVTGLIANVVSPKAQAKIVIEAEDRIPTSDGIE